MSRKQSRKAELTNLWQSTKSAAEFINSIYERKFFLLRCDCRKFWVVDQRHVHSLETSADFVVHSLATSLEGVSDDPQAPARPIADDRRADSAHGIREGRASATRSNLARPC
jgi:hypothetical protein